MALARPESNQPLQKILTNSVSMPTVSPVPVPVPVPVPAPHSSLRPLSTNVHSNTPSKLTGTNGVSGAPAGAFAQSSTLTSPQEGAPDKQVEQSKLVSGNGNETGKKTSLSVRFSARVRFDRIFFFLGGSHLRAQEGRSVVGHSAAQADGGAAPQVALGLPAGGDAVDGRRLRPGAEVEGGGCQEGGRKK